MHLAIDGRRIRREHSGLGVYSLNLIASLIKHEDLRLTIYIHPDAAAYLKPVDTEKQRWVVVPYGVDNHGSGEIWKHIRLPVDLRRRGVNVFHDLGYQLPMISQSPLIRNVVTVHDLAPFTFPETNTVKYGLYWKFMTRSSISRADRIVAVSRFAADEICERFRLAAERVEVIHSAVPLDFRPNDCLVSRERRPYILVTANFEPRKNLRGLLLAFNHLIRNRHLDIDLHVIGNLAWKNREALNVIRECGLEDRVHCIGYIGQDALIRQYHLAELVVVPSFYEGFGFPLLEAMATGTPVVSSNTSSLPEIGGDAPVYIDPHDVEDMAEGIERALTDSELRVGMRERGLRRAADFSWETTARSYVETYRKLI